MKTIITAIFVISFVLGSTAAFAKGQFSPGIKKHRQCRELAMEVAHRLSTQLTNTDQNKDGQLSPSETADQKVRAACFRHLDRNHDGQLSATELRRFA
ncbi:MAG: hypothetical protein ABI644_14960 [Arenimonas sp.]